MLDTIWNWFTNEKFFVAIISAIVSFSTLIVSLMTKNFIDTRILKSKLETEHIFEQQKKIKEVLAKYKVHLVNSAAMLNDRLWNFEKHHKSQWLNTNGKYGKDGNYYFHSFIYRFVVFFAWIRHIEKDMIFLDTTISINKDLDLIKFLKIFNDIFTDFSLVEDENKSGENPTDHFYQNLFEEIPNMVYQENGVKSFSEFKSELDTFVEQDKSIFLFFDGLSPNEDRRRFDRLYLLHITLVLFLNQYGYDFQQTNDDKRNKLIGFEYKSAYIDRLSRLFDDYKLNNIEIKKILNIL